MSSFLCFLCHNTVNSDTNEETREKYREVVGMNLCPDSHLCYICSHMLKKLWLFKSVCLKRSLEYPVLFSEKGILNLQRSDIETTIVCSEKICVQSHTTQVYVENRNSSIHSNIYIKLDDLNDLDLPENTTETNKKENCKNINKTQEFDNNYINFENSEQQFENCDRDFENSEQQFESCANDFENDDENFESNDVANNDCYSPSEEGNIDFESNKDREVDLDNKEGIAEDSEINYECYDEERNECLEEIRHGNTDEEKYKSKKKSKTKKSEQKDFEKLLLSTEEQKSELDAQRKSKKYLEAEFKCYNCAIGFLFKDTYQAHMMRHEESNGEYRCELCSLRFATGAVLRSHISLHSVRYRCSRCAQLVRARRTQTHAKYCHDKACVATCHLCGRVFQDASGLQQHLKRFHQSKTSNRTYSCSVCGKSYNNQAAVRTHMIKHIHRKFTCDECPSTFSSPYTLQQHKKKHRTVLSVAEHCCDICGARFNSRKSLLAHARSAPDHHHNTYECPICNRSCPNERSLSSHISTVHSATKPFRCPTCPARYTSRKSLVRHVRSHSVPPQPKIAVCHICGNSFKGKSKLNRHLREVCEKDKLEEELSSYYEQQQNMI